jgi:outer membrane protein TolC
MRSKIVTAMAVTAMSLQASALTLSEYITQVTGQNDSAVASDLTSRGAMMRKGEGSIPFATNYYFNGSYLDDQRLTGAPSFQGRDTRSTRYETGFSQKFRFGMDASIGYVQQQTRVYGVNPAIVRFYDFYDQAFQLNLTQSLWRNWLGKESVAQEKASVENAKALSYREEFNLRVLESDARVSYWNLVQALANVEIQKEAVARSEKILASNKSKFDRQLTDKIDFLQSDANLQFRQLQLKQAYQDLSRMARTFNLLRGVEGDKVEGTLTSETNKNEIDKLTIPTKGEMRADVKAILAQSLAERAVTESSYELSKPKLEVFAQLSSNGKDRTWSTAYNQANSNTFTNNAVGVRFLAPLDFELLKQNKEGRSLEARAADLRFKRKAFEVDREWVDTLTRYNDARDRLDLARKIESAQKAKTAHERNRLSQGLTTTFQSLNFEQEFADSQLSRLRAETEVLSLHARLRLFANQ